MTSLRDCTGSAGAKSSRVPQRLSIRAFSLLLGVVACSFVVGAVTPDAAQAQSSRSSRSSKRSSSSKKSSSRSSSRGRTTKVATVKVSTARLRSKPGTKASAKDTLDSGEKAKIVGRSGDWIKVRTAEGRDGWIREDLVREGRGSFQEKSENNSKSSRSSRSASGRSYSSRTKATKSTSSRSTAKATPKRYSKPVPKIAAKPATKSAAKPTVTASAPKPRQPFLRGQSLRPTSANPTMTASAPKAEPKPAEETKVAVVSPDVPEENTLVLEMNTESTPIIAKDTTLEAKAKDAQKDRDAKAEAAGVLPEELELRSSRVVRGAMSYRGTPYRMGATGRGAFDCSAFVRHIFAKEGKYLPRTAAEQYGVGKPVDKSDLKPGDLVFFKNTYKRGISHVGIYIGNGQFIHASSGGGAVCVSTLSDSYYVKHWAGGKRL